MPLPQEYSPVFLWAYVRKALSSDEVRDWYDEWKTFINMIEQDVKTNRVRRVLRSDTTPYTLDYLESNAVIENGTLSLQQYNLPQINSDSVGMFFIVFSDDGTHQISLKTSGGDEIFINGVLQGDEYVVSQGMVILVATDLGRWILNPEIPAHGLSHELGGNDQLDLTGLTGFLGTRQTDEWTTGWESIFSYEISFDDGTRTLTIQNPTTPVPSSYYRHYQLGVPFEKNTPESIQIPDTEGFHLVYYDNGVLQTELGSVVGGSVSTYIRLYAFVAWIYWDATNDQALRVLGEPHTVLMSTGTHTYLHTTVGTRYARGLGLTDIIPNSTSPTIVNAQFGIETGVIADEDVPHFPAAVTSATGYPIFTFEGLSTNAYIRENSNPGLPFLQGGNGRLIIQDDTSGTWVTVECPDNVYAAVHVFVDTSVDASRAPFTVPGRSYHSTIAAAAAAAEAESIAIKGSGIIGPEVLRVASVLYRTRTAYAYPCVYSTPEGWDYIDYRISQGGSAGASGTSQSLDDLLDVQILSPGHGDRLVFDVTSGLWVNSPYVGFRRNTTEVNTASYTAIFSDDVINVAYPGFTEIILPDSERALAGRGFSISDANRMMAFDYNIDILNESGVLIYRINTSGGTADIRSNGTAWGVV